MSSETYSRRTVMRAGAGAALGGLAVANARPVRAQSDFDGWLDGVDNYDGVVDETGADEVTIEVGVEANGGNFGFGPAAVQVDPGTQVTWEWVAGSHDVADEAGNFGSELTDEAGHTFSQTFDEEGVVKYFCTPHRSMGMRGVVIVGDAAGGSQSGGGESGNGLPDQPSFDGWMEGVANYDGVVDETGAGEVTVEVGVEANGGNFGFGPAAIQVDPGTQVTWEWVNGSHDVVDEAGNFSSELVGDEGHTFSQTFEEEGVVKYFCTPHRSMGMRAVVVVGEPSLGGGDGSSDGSSDGGSGGDGSDGGDDGMSTADWGAVAFGLSLVAGLLSPLAFAAFLDRDDER